jgi:purine-binding chemotaxis protein CheW
MHCALPVQHVVETMRPLPLDILPGAPDFVVGIAIVRGAPLPIVSVSRLLDESEGNTGRFVIVKTGARRVGLVVDEIVGFRTLNREAFAQLPPLLAIASATAVAQIAVLDGELLAVLGATGIVPEAMFNSIAALAAAS